MAGNTNWPTSFVVVSVMREGLPGFGVTFGPGVLATNISLVAFDKGSRGQDQGPHLLGAPM